MTLSTHQRLNQRIGSRKSQKNRFRSVASRGYGLPDLFANKDTGCELAPSCLACPLERCKHDDPGIMRRNRSTKRDKEIVQLRASGKSVADIAIAVGVSERTVYRVIQRKYYPKVAAA